MPTPDESTYYIRFRGRITGPFPKGEIRGMLARGTIGRFHQLSVDGTIWQPSGECPAFMPPPEPAKNPQEPASQTFDQRCPSCDAGLRFKPFMHGRSIQCPRCFVEFSAMDPAQTRAGSEPGEDSAIAELAAAPDLPLDSLAAATQPQSVDSQTDAEPHPQDDTRSPDAAPSRDARRVQRRGSKNRDGLHNDTLAFAPDKERRRLQIECIILSSVVVAAFFWPHLDTSLDPSGGTSIGLHFLNIEGLFQPSVPGLLSLVLLYPLIGGLGALFTSIYAPPLARSITYCCIGGLFMIIVFANQGSIAAVRNLGAVPGGAGMITLWIFWLLGLGMMIVGIRLRRYRPTYTGAYIIGAVGAVFYLLSLVVPALPVEAGGLWLAMPFELIKQNVFLGIGSLLQMLCLIAVGVLCAANTPRVSAPRAVSLSVISLGLIAASIVVALVFTLLAGIDQPNSFGGKSMMGLMIASLLLKMVLFIGSIMLLVPVGVADLILTLRSHRPDSE